MEGDEMNCLICYHHFDNNKKVPYLVCYNGHTICKECKEIIEKEEGGVCPLCRALLLPNCGIVNRLALDLSLKHSSPSPPPSPLLHSNNNNNNNNSENNNNNIDENFSDINNTNNTNANKEDKEEGEELFAKGKVVKFYGGYEEQVEYENELGRKVEWSGRLTLIRSSPEEIFQWKDEVYGTGEGCHIFSKQEDEGEGEIKLIANLMWSTQPEFQLSDLPNIKAESQIDHETGSELLVGSFDKKTKKLRLRGIAVRQTTPTVATTGYLFYLSSFYDSPHHGGSLSSSLSSSSSAAPSPPSSSSPSNKTFMLRGHCRHENQFGYEILSFSSL